MASLQILGFLLLAISVTSIAHVIDDIATSYKPYDDAWTAFKNKFDRNYTGDEETTRFNAFVERVKLIEAHNQRYEKKEENYTMGITQFTDALAGDIGSCHVDDDEGASDMIRIGGFCGDFILSKDPLPYSKDWRDSNAVTPVGYQGHCGSCYAFATATTISAQLKKSTGKLIPLSEQQLVDCGNGGCEGSNAVTTFKYISNVGGIVPSSIYPYRQAAKAKAAEKEDTKTAAPKAEAKKRGRATKEENGEDKEDAGEPAPKLVKKVSDGMASMDFSSSAKTEDGRAWNFKIASWNINGVRAWLSKDGQAYLSQEKPDVLCMQETKCSDAKLPHAELKAEGYTAYWASAKKEGYAGTGIYSKTKPVAVTYGIGKDEHDDEGRVITAEFEKLYLVTAYVPNSGQGLVRLKYRTKEWDEDLSAYLKGLDAKKPVVLCGDLNVAHLDIDLKNPKSNKRNAGFTKEEREGFGKLLDQGFIDSFRTLYPDKEDAYTFWSNFRQAKERNIGWRLDYFVLSERLKKDLCDNVIRPQVMGSDHCPIVLLLAL